MQRYRVVFATLIVFLLTACNGNKTIPAPAAPVFSSTPVTQAAEATPYSYQLVASGTAVTFSLTNAPVGATLSGSTISWTPTAQQSRVPNSFTVTATASGGVSATQSWTVTPSGTIRISWVDTYWNEDGSTDKPFDWSPVSSFVAALVPQPDGSFKSLFGTAGVSGAFEIPNVPAGYYWLRIAPRGIYWTSSSTFDMGTDFFARVVNGTAPTTSTTYFNFSFTSLDATPARGLLRLDTPDTSFPTYSALTNAGSTTFAGALVMNTNLDLSVIKNAIVRQYEPASFGAVNGYVMGPALTLSNLSWTNGGHNAISGALNLTVPASINLSVKGSAWTQLLDHIAPTTPAVLGGNFSLSVQPYIVDNPNISISNPIDLLWTSGSSPALHTSSCSSNLPLTMDVDAGTVQYNDPFPSGWRRTFSVCQSASVSVQVPGGKTQSIILTNSQTATPPTTAVKPLISAVQNPKINGADLFTAGTINSTAVTLSWDPPAIGTPFGYNVEIMRPVTLLTGEASYVSTTTLGTAKTSMTVPLDLFQSGQTYLLVITSLADGRANMETSPHRSSLPSASAQLISAPMTIVTN